jgi:urease accessory protein
MGSLLTLLQLADSAFPSGSFAHSDGVEALSALGLLDGPAGLQACLAAHGRLSLNRGDATFVRAAHRATLASDAAALTGVAEEELASRASLVQREASLAVGGNLLRAAHAIEGESLRLAAATLGARAPRATAFGAVSAALGAGPQDAAEACAYTVLAEMAAAAVRLRVVGAADGQRALRQALEAGVDDDTPEPWFFSPLLDVAAMRHETLEPRLFAS